MNAAQSIVQRAAMMLVVGGTMAFAGVDPASLPAPAARQVDFATDIRPMLERNCLKCHGPERPKSRFRLDNRESALKGGGNNADDIVPGDSANSRLVHYVAGLVEDMEMPPVGQGEPLPAEQISLIRAWIDQGAQWVSKPNEPAITLSLTPAAGFASVHGNEAEFRQHQWMRDGWRGGIESFQGTQQLSPYDRVTLNVRALTDDYRAELLREKQDVGFITLGFEQYRKYDSATGGYFPDFSPSVFSLDHELHLDVGRAWADFGLTFPDWPRITLGYELQYRQGDKATLQWGPVTENGTTRNIYPAYESIKERVHILKLDVSLDRNGWVAEDNLRIELADQNTTDHNISGFTPVTPDSMVTDTVQQGWHSLQGANTMHIERRFKDWFYGTAGYLYSHLSADADFSLDTINPAGAPVLPPYIQRIEWRSQRIVLERESHVANANALLGPWKSATLALGMQSEWTRQNGTLEGSENPVPTPAFPFDLTVPVSGISDIDKAVMDESAKLKYTQLPFTTLFAEARLRQEWISHHEDAEGTQSFIRNTEARSDKREFRAGFDTSPRTWLKIDSQYRHSDNSTSYNDGLADGDPSDILGYPTFIKARDLTTQQVESRLNLRPCDWLNTTFTHRIVTTDYHTTTESLTVLAPGDAAPGGNLIAGSYDAQTFGFSTALSPWRRLHLSTTVSYQDVRSVARHDGSDAVVPYRGDIWSVVAFARLALTKKMDVTAGWNLSVADFHQNNFSSGLPVGMDYELHGLNVGLVSHRTENFTVKLQYGFYNYDEPSSGGASDYTAHAVFAAVNYRLP